MTATVSTMMDCIGMTLCALYQYIVGYVVDFNWNGALNPDGSRLHTADDLVLGLSSVIVIMILCFIVSLFLIRKQKPSTTSSTV
jgi:multisubunit Na+/H+ antiporter MnhB subunit